MGKRIQKTTVPQLVFGTAGVAAMFGCSVEHVAQQTKKGIIPCLKRQGDYDEFRYYAPAVLAHFGIQVTAPELVLAMQIATLAANGELPVSITPPPPVEVNEAKRVEYADGMVCSQHDNQWYVYLPEAVRELGVIVLRDERQEPRRFATLAEAREAGLQASRANVSQRVQGV